MSAPRCYTDEGDPAREGVPPIPWPVRQTAARKGLALRDLVYDGLGGFWYPRDGWRGMFLGIEADGYAHT